MPATPTPTSTPAIIARIEQRRAVLIARGIKPHTPRGLSKASGLGAGFLDDLMKKDKVKQPKAENIAKLAPALRTTAAWLLTGDGPEDVDDTGDVLPAPALAPDATGLPRDVPIRGRAGGALSGPELDEATTTVMQSAVGLVYRLHGVMGVPNVYALRVSGTSMVPEFRPNALIYVDPNRVPVPGDAVVVHLRTHAGAPVRLVLKTFEGYDGDWLLLSRHNPPARERARRDTVADVHKVLTLAELIGI